MGVFKRRYKNSKGEQVEAKNWSCEFFIDGERYCKTLAGTGELGKKKAERLCEDLKEETEAKINGVIEAKVLFEDAMTLYYKDYLQRINDRREASHKKIQDKYVYKIPTVLDAFQGLSLKEINRKHFVNFINKRRRDGVKDSTIRDELNFIQAMYNYANAIGICDDKDLPNFKPVIKTLRRSKQQIRWLTPDEYVKIIEVINKKLEVRNAFYTRQRKRIIKLAVFSGLRREEYLSLRKEHIVFEQNTITVLDTKNGRDRLLPMNSIIRELLHEQLQDTTDMEIETDWLFCRPDGKRIFDFDGFYHDCKVAGIPHCKIHDLRKTFGTWQLIRGERIEKISKFLGHSSIAQTQEAYSFIDILLQDENFIKLLQEQLHKLYGEKTDKRGNNG